MLPSGGWGNFLLLKDPISLTCENKTSETKCRRIISPPYANQDSLYAAVPPPLDEDAELGRINLTVCLADERQINTGQELHGGWLFRIRFTTVNLEAVDTVFVHSLQRAISLRCRGSGVHLSGDLHGLGQ